MEDISSQQLIGECNKSHVIAACRDKNIFRKDIQENRYRFNKIRHIQSIGNKLIGVPTKPLARDHIGGVVQSPLISEWIDSIFSNHKKMEKSTTFSAPFLCYLLQQDTKMIRPKKYFRVKTTDIDNKYEIYSRKISDESSIIEGTNVKT